MEIHPVIAELRRDPAPQQRAQAALERTRDDWRNRPEVAALLTQLAGFGAGGSLSDCPELDCALHDTAFARELVDRLVSALAAAVDGEPLGHVPLRHQYSPGLAVLQLAAAGSAALSLVCYEGLGARSQLAETVCFAGGDRHELCLVGAAEARFFEVLQEEPQRADLDCESRLIEAGDALAFSGPRHTRIVDRPRRRMVLLRLSRSAPVPTPAREYRISDGSLVHCASGDRAESRDEMAAAVLGAMQRSDAAPILAGIARKEGSDHLRWQALRQTLALDTRIGFEALAAIATDEMDGLAPAAGALHASLVERHPVLAEWRPPCPA